MTALSSSISNLQTRRRATMGYYLAFIVLGLATSALGPTLPALAEHTGVQLKQVSFLFLTRSFGYLLGSVIGGRLYDRLSGHQVLRWMLLIFATALALVPGIRWLGVLTGVLLFLGVAEGALDVGGNTLLVWQFQRDSGPFLNGLHFFFGVGAFVSPLLVAAAIQFELGLAGTYWIIALLALPAYALLNISSSPRRPLEGSDRSAGLSRPDLVVGTMLLLALYVGAESGYGGWVFAYGLAQGIPETIAATLTSAFWGALTLGRLASIPLAARFRPSRILWFDYSLCLVSTVILGLSGYFLPAAWRSAGLWIGTLGLGLGMASVFPTAIAMAGRRMALTGTVTSWFMVGVALGGMSLPWLVGQFFESVGPYTLVIGVGVALVMGVLVLVWLLRRSAMKSGVHEPS